jgi:hypothetical protein
LQSDFKEQETLRHYLLGQATEEESSSLEERLLTDSALLQALLIVEDDLIDHYLSDELTPTERQKFETRFLTAPERQRKFRFGRALHQYVKVAAAAEQYSTQNVTGEKPDVAKPPPKRGVFSFLPFTNPLVTYSLSAAMLVILAGVSWAVFNNWRQQTHQQQGNVYVVTLTPGLTRDTGEIKKFTIPPGPGAILLRLALPENQYQSYKAVLLDSNGDILLTKSNLKAQSTNGQPTLLVDVSPDLVPLGDYRVTLGGLTAKGDSESVSSYSFRVLGQ